MHWPLRALGLRLAHSKLAMMLPANAPEVHVHPALNQTAKQDAVESVDACCPPALEWFFQTRG